MRKITLLISVLMLALTGVRADDWTESFDELSGSYYTGTKSLVSGDWEFVAVYPESSGDSRTGAHACRINDDTEGALLRIPLLNTIGTVSFYYR